MACVTFLLTSFTTCPTIIHMNPRKTTKQKIGSETYRFKLPRELWRALQKLSAEDDRDMTDYVRRVLRRHVEQATGQGGGTA